MPKLAVCWIWQSPFVWTKSVDSMLRLRRPNGYDVEFFRGGGWGPAKRHINACELAVEWGADRIVILGADQVYEPDLLERLVARREAGHEVVAALVPTRGYLAWENMKPFQPMAWKLKSNGLEKIGWDRSSLQQIDPANGEMQRIDFIGSGCIMFDTDHLLALKKPWFFEKIDHETQNRIACMDTTFCYRLREEAYAQVWCDTTIKIKHIHDMEVDDTFQNRFMDWVEPSVGDPAICRHEQPTLTPVSA